MFVFVIIIIIICFCLFKVIIVVGFACSKLVLLFWWCNVGVGDCFLLLNKPGVLASLAADSGTLLLFLAMTLKFNLGFKFLILLK